MTQILDGRIVAADIHQQIKKYTESTSGILTLGIILAGNAQPSEAYIKRKVAVAKNLGIATRIIRLPEESSTADIILQISQFNTDKDITGYIVQLPLPKHIDTTAVLAAIQPSKDADGLSPHNMGLLVNNTYSIVPATTRGIMSLLNYYQINVASQHVVIVGRSYLVGKPTAIHILNQNATVSLAHSHTANLKDLTQAADILILAMGQPQLITSEYIKEEAVVIDVGITKTPTGIHGDANHQSLHGKAKAITPVPGGIGPLTVACLFQNLIDLHSQASK